MNNFIYIFIGIGLSMDTFSLSIAYGTNNIKKNRICLLSILVGIFHYIMPFIGSIIGNKLKFLIKNSNYIVSLIFLLISIEMYHSRKNNRSLLFTNFLSLLIFSITVSIDSFSVGLALSLNNNNLLSIFTIFSIISAFFTFIGLYLGKYLRGKLGNNSLYIGIIILLVIAIKYLFT